MLIIDIESSGLSPYKNSICSIGAVDFETNKEFYGECRVADDREINEGALKINGFTVEQLKDPNKPTDLELFAKFGAWHVEMLLEWMQNDSNIDRSLNNVLAGENVGHFDILFLEEMHQRLLATNPTLGKFPFSYRTVDLHTLGFAVFGESLSLKQLCEKLGIEPEACPHNALLGAKKEKECLVKLLGIIKL